MELSGAQCDLMAMFWTTLTCLDPFLCVQNKILPSTCYWIFFTKPCTLKMFNFLYSFQNSHSLSQQFACLNSFSVDFVKWTSNWWTIIFWFYGYECQSACYVVVQNWMQSRDWNFEVECDILCQNRPPDEFFSRPAKGSFLKWKTFLLGEMQN